CDLTKESDILSMFQEIRQIYGRVDICINNAGLGYDEPLLTGSTAEFRNMLDVNVMAMCICTQLVVQLMQENGGDGQIIHISRCDLTKESDILSMFQEVRQIYGRVDICINNAGLGYDEPLLTGSTSEFRNMLDVNVMALCICTKLAVQLMQENGGDGQIIHISRYPGIY
ncbi:Dehydrogenase/reductase SDR family member 11, partial [Araneus ventricosus]